MIEAFALRIIKGLKIEAPLLVAIERLFEFTSH